MTMKIIVKATIIKAIKECLARRAVDLRVAFQQDIQENLDSIDMEMEKLNNALFYITEGKQGNRIGR